MQRNLLKNPSLMSHLLTSSLPLCLFSAGGLVPAPLCDVLDTHTIPIMESLSFHPHSRWKLYQMVSLSTSPPPPSIFVCLLQFLFLACVAVSICHCSILLFLCRLVHPKLLTLPLFNILFSPAFLTSPAT